jgi:hypothetical protein
MTTLTNEHEQNTIFDFDVRLAITKLAWKFFEANWPDRTKNDLIDWAGLIPDFFLHAIQETDADDVQAVAEAMDKVYGFNALGYPFKDTRMVPGDHGPVLRHPDDEDIKPILAVGYEGRRVKCVVYPYGLVGLINSRGDQLVFRMD